MLLFKIAAVGFVAIAVIAAGAYAYIARGSTPVHPSLVAGSLPPLIPVRDFYANTGAEWAYTPSHDGSLIAWYGVDWTKTVIRVKRTTDAKPFLTLSGVGFDAFRWHPHKNELIITVEQRLWQVDPAKPERANWIDITPRGFQNWNIATTPIAPDDRIVVASNDRDPALIDLYSVRQDGGGKELIEKNEGKTFNWWLDPRGVPRVRVDRLDSGDARFLIRDGVDVPWRPLTDVAARDTFALLFAPMDGKPLYVLSDRGRDRVALVTIDLQTSAETVVADHPNVDARKVFALADNAIEPDFVTFEDGYTHYRSFTRAGETFLKLLLDGDNPVDFNILGTSPDGRFVTVARSWREQSFEYFLYDLERGQATRLAENDFRRHKNVLVETKPVSFKARDGLEITAFLTLPRGIEPRNLPTIVVIHGGPAQQEIWAYNPDYQFLANRGYAMLSVNFRGSTGYGKNFRAAGYGQIGKAMQDDIVDAANWLVAQGIADKTNLAVMGGSYGGYSAALAMTRDPGLFKAAIVEYGVTDIAYQMQNNPFSWGLHLDEVKRYFGDPENKTDLEEMRQRSPLMHAENVQGAILITAGKDDRMVGFEQSEEFERALKAAEKDVMATYFEKEGHGYERWQTKLRRARLIEDFLAKHLGGRTGGFDYTELAAKYLN
ncbi:S9 family peptidase [Mesorhizobium sp. YR577]|uniref:alpha/beta hydrolase family protein n=1 Tax=Mesorhizobium sp. YR577 TaxID=1884373 RepID=UPI0008EEE0C9|nr:S9 family peptidase [Mesorhizobium sp. YR577]SFU23040.1 Dipeptidyl aminopeptidase/acylaminoacyl peptidase [Mesorhizobium sp. YR577]